MKKRRLLCSVLAAVMTVSLFGCGAKKEASNTKEEKKDLKGSKLKVFAAYGNKEKIFEQFEKDTGIKVEFMDVSSGEVLSRAKAEKGKAIGDVWFGGGLDSFIAAKNEGLLEKYVSPEAENIKDEYRDKDGYWTGVSLVMAGFIVNKDLMKEKNLKIPESWEELAKPEYKGEVLMANPAISGTTYAAISGILQQMGEEKGWEYFKALDKNVPFYAKRGGEPPTKANQGEVGIGIAPMSGEFIANTTKYPIQPVFPKDGVPWTPAPVSIFKGAENLDGAKAFVDWCLSKKGQEVLRDNDPRIPTRKDVENPEALKPYGDINLIKIDLEKAGKERENIIGTWNKEFKR
ncbi:ABC transporter substrate-binding protein [Haloimpatiens lingqiaonensis]|uniref:ABC transporter substrate-binding protein n=1 Tax=Haloimpatiens lingqiaonensis TaxID=1380675 RepID=UPI0010FDBF7B|nr:ABC transporter substrate-binding protein [Haloimpatiens lingqiaonensis]